MADEDRTIKLVTPRPKIGPAETRWTLSVFTMQELMKKGKRATP